jgi:cytochrome c peroxidase
MTVKETIKAFDKMILDSKGLDLDCFLLTNDSKFNKKEYKGNRVFKHILMPKGQIYFCKDFFVTREELNISIN